MHMYRIRPKCPFHGTLHEAVKLIYALYVHVPLDICIKDFLKSFRESFPNVNISPKLHLLEDHAVDQLRRFRVGFGLLNEQGGELIHTDFNRTGRVVHGMKDPLQRLMAVMKRHLTSTTPEVQANMASPFRKHEC